MNPVLTIYPKGLLERLEELEVPMRVSDLFWATVGWLPALVRREGQTAWKGRVLINDREEERCSVSDMEIIAPRGTTFNRKAVDAVEDKAWLSHPGIESDRITFHGISPINANAIAGIVLDHEVRGSLLHKKRRRRTMSSDLVEIGALWISESKDGSRKFMAGNLGGTKGSSARILCFKNEKKEKDSHPDYRLYLAPKRRLEEGSGGGSGSDDDSILL